MGMRGWNGTGDCGNENKYRKLGMTMRGWNGKTLQFIHVHVFCVKCFSDRNTCTCTLRQLLSVSA